MKGAASIDAPRTIRIATLLAALAAGVLVYLAYAPRIAAAERRLDDDVAQLASDEIAIGETAAMRASRDVLARRYAALFAKSPQAVFVRDLGKTALRSGVTIVGTTATHDPEADAARAPGSVLRGTTMTVELAGSYRGVLAAIADLSLGSEVVRVDAPTLRRRDGGVDATIPITLFEPAGGTP